MPVTVNGTYEAQLNPPRIVITIGDDGGGTTPHVVDVYVGYDRTYLKDKVYLKPKVTYDNTPSMGRCAWYRHSWYPGVDPLELGLESLGVGVTKVVVTAIDPFLGQADSDVIVVPNKVRSTRARGKRRKKA